MRICLISGWWCVIPASAHIIRSSTLFLAKMTGQERYKWELSENWTTAIWHKWHKPQSIHLLEAEAIVLSLRWITRRSGNINKRIVLYTYCQTVKGALTKGRNSKPTLNMICRKVAGLILATRLKPDLLYIQSVANTADGPSRFI